MKSKLDGHKTTGTYVRATVTRAEPVGTKWVFSYKAGKHGMAGKTKEKNVAKGCSQVQDVDFQTFASPIVSVSRTSGGRCK